MNAFTPDPETTIDFIFDLFAKQGASEYIGEAVTMSQHMEQSAACAAADGAPDSLAISALLHDIGHFIGEHPIEALENGIDNSHEEVGARYLAAHFPASVSEPVRLHVAAKRYLCATDDDGKVAGLTIKPVTAYRETLTSLMPQ